MTRLLTRPSLFVALGLYSIALTDGERAIAGPHVGDLDSTLAIDAMRRHAAELAAAPVEDPAGDLVAEHRPWLAAAG